MVRDLRLIIRATALLASGAAFYLALVVGRALAWSVAAELKVRNAVLRGWAKSACAIIGVRIKTRGEPPKAPFFLVSNHLSYIDILVFATQLDCVFIAKSEVGEWPGIGSAARGAGTIFLERRNFQDLPRVISLIDRKLDAGLGVILFAEGTSTRGDQVLPFSPALLEPAARSSYPVSYASISYRTPPGETPAEWSVCWWGEMLLLPHLRELLKLPYFEALVVFGSHAIQADDRKLLAGSLWRAVDRQLMSQKEEDSLRADHADQQNHR